MTTLTASAAEPTLTIIPRYRGGAKVGRRKKRREASTMYKVSRLQPQKPPRSQSSALATSKLSRLQLLQVNFFIHYSMSLPLKLVAGVKCLCTLLSKQTEVLPRPAKLDEPLGVILRHWSGIVSLSSGSKQFFLAQIGRSCHRLKSD